MLGWEFPPFISGGLGTACFGLTKALVARGAEVAFVLPRAINRSHSSHVEVISPTADAFRGAPRQLTGTEAAGSDASGGGNGAAASALLPAQALARLPVPLRAWLERLSEADREGLIRALTDRTLPDAYDAAHAVAERTASCATAPVLGGRLRMSDHAWLQAVLSDPTVAASEAISALRQRAQGPEAVPEPLEAGPVLSGRSEYDGDLFGAAARFARFAVAACAWRDFDVIHAHDWLTYPAGIALAAATGKPLVVHVHATEFDRSGDAVDQRVYSIERRGMHAAVRVVAVSQLTANLLANRYGVAPGKVDVIYNGVDFDPASAGISRIDRSEKIVLYFGRITMQKGPEYFVRAAKRALEVMPGIRFVVAGSGDQAQRMIEMAAALGIGGRMTFTGFLRGKDIQRIFRMADLYVMPSVSEPFGIAPLEAMVHHVPAIISRSSGVSEVLSHVLKVDFWDVDDIANKMVAVLRHPPLRQHLSQQGYYEVRGITWDGAAERCVRCYEQAEASIRRPRVRAPSCALP